jgi:hypothetical protein
MKQNPYVMLVLAVGLLYYLIFRYKYYYRYDRSWQIIGIVSVLCGTAASIATILEAQFPSLESTISTVMFPVVTVLILVLFYLLTVESWKERNNPEMKTSVYVWFGGLAFLGLSLIVIFILAQVGFFG